MPSEFAHDGLVKPLRETPDADPGDDASRPPVYRLRASQVALLATRKAARGVARKLKADVDYDIRLYEAIGSLRSWTPGDVVFDIGANDGRTVFRLLRHLPSPHIHAFEPVAETFRVLGERTAGFLNVERHRLGMGSEPARLPIHLSTRAALNSLYPDWNVSHGTEVVDITTVDRFAEQAGVDRIPLLKIDTEGHDLEVLKGAQESLRQGRVDIVMAECGFSAPGCRRPSLDRFQAYLRSFGYFLHGIYNQCRGPLPPREGGASVRGSGPPILIFCDALFVRTHGT